MQLREDLLTPIPGENPGGENLRYAGVYDKIKEARREDDEDPQGDWKHERKKADHKLVLKLSQEALATKSKDLQLAAWITEALLKQDGFPGLLQGLELIRGLVENFWDHLYPEIEDGDAELRATPLEWVATRFEDTLKRVPLTKDGLNFFDYKLSRMVGFEADATDESRQQARAQAIADGKPTGEDFDNAFAATPKAFYKQAVDDLDACIEKSDALNELCEAKFGDAHPSFGKLHEHLEIVRTQFNAFLNKKRETEPDEEAPGEAVAEEAPAEEAVSAGGGAAAAPARAKAVSVEPSDHEDAIHRVAIVAKFLRQEDGYSPVPYLLLRALRWGELRAGGANLDPALLLAPATEVRQNVKRLALEANWQELLETAETAMGSPSCRAWLDLQRHVLHACEQLGSYYEPIADAVRGALLELLAQYPQLPQMTLADDTPVANTETQTWLKRVAVPKSEQQGPSMSEEPAATAPEAAGVPDALKLATEAAAGGRLEDAINILTEQAAQERSARARFQRRLQLAQLCMNAGQDEIAYPILQALAAEIDEKHLDSWESSDIVAYPLTLLLRCMTKMDADPAERQKLYARICRLDPAQALKLTH